MKSLLRIFRRQARLRPFTHTNTRPEAETPHHGNAGPIAGATDEQKVIALCRETPDPLTTALTLIQFASIAKEPEATRLAYHAAQIFAAEKLEPKK